MILNKLFITVTLIFIVSFSSKAVNIDSLVQEIKRSLPKEWTLTHLNDTVICLSPMHKIAGGYQSNLIDSLEYKIFFIFRHEHKEISYYKEEFKKIVESFDEKSLNINSFSFDPYFREEINKMPKIVIPPNIIFDDYSIVIFDNIKYGGSYALYPMSKVNAIDRQIKTVILQLVDEGVFVSYQKDMSMNFLVNMESFFGLLYWGEIRKINYPFLF